ncbi:MAG TPA: extracellular solute-binding protein [Bacilli bacterium]|nr:extracellular solute-binding protein [Bacilli bacterium]
MFKQKKSLFLIASALVLAACGGGGGDKETIRLQVWGPEKEGEKEVYNYLAAEFQKLHTDITFKITYGDVGEGDAATQALADVDTAADIFMFADDQLSNLVEKGVLNALSTTYANKVKTRDLDASVQAATYKKGTDEEKLFAFPLAADNGYFLYYNSAFFTDAEVDSLETMLAKTDATHQFVMDMGNGYYSVAPIMNVGEISYDPVAKVHTTDYNGTKSVDAMQGFMNLVQPKLDKGFKNDNPDNVLADFGDTEGNKVVAAVTGVWNADNIEGYLGTKYAASKLPTFKSADDSTVQMGAFAGSKLVGVKSSTAQPAWALAFADFITDEAAQTYRFAEIGKGPSNIVVSGSTAVQANEALAALGAQAEFAIPQSKSVGSAFWDASAAVGNFVVNGPASEDAPQTIKAQLDAFVAAITLAS